MLCKDIGQANAQNWCVEFRHREDRFDEETINGSGQNTGYHGGKHAVGQRDEQVCQEHPVLHPEQ